MGRGPGRATCDHGLRPIPIRRRVDALFSPRWKTARDAMLRVSGLPLDDLLPDYVFVRLADLISLTFCTGWTDEQRFGEWTVRLSDT